MSSPRSQPLDISPLFSKMFNENIHKIHIQHIELKYGASRQALLPLVELELVGFETCSEAKGRMGSQASVSLAEGRCYCGKASANCAGGVQSD